MDKLKIYVTSVETLSEVSIFYLFKNNVSDEIGEVCKLPKRRKYFIKSSVHTKKGTFKLDTKKALLAN